MSPVATPPETNGQDDATILVARGVDAIEQGAQQTHRKFLWTWLALALLATISGFGVLVGLTNAHDRTVEAKDKAQQVKVQSDDIVGYLKGDNGLPGVPGKNGVPGTPGLPGQRGPEGPQGVKGSKGAKGDTGPMGPAGPAGAAGAPGSPGVNGEAGAQGQAGEKGSTGSSGTAGTGGATGPTGPPGPQGAQGPAGPAGPPGSSCPAGTASTQIPATDVNGRAVVIAACALP